MLAQCLLVGPTLAHTHAILIPTHAAANIGTPFAPMQYSCQLVTPLELAQMLQHMQDPCQHWAQPELAHLLLRKNHANCLTNVGPGEGVDL
jgi:hypothetical protein